MTDWWSADPVAESTPRITVTPNRDVPPVGRALLDAIAGSESTGYDVTYGGGKFGDFADHPRRSVPIPSGPNAGRTSSAAGRYQFLAPTWDRVVKETGLTDFSPESQDAGAWHLATQTYKTKTGRDLERDLTSAKGNPHAVAGIGKMLAGTWTSLPGGIEPNSQTMAFADRFDRSAAPGPFTPLEPTAPVKSVPGPFTPLEPTAPAKAAAPADWWSSDPVAPPSSGAERPPDGSAPLADTGGRFTDTAGESFRTAREGVSPTVATKGEGFSSGAARGASFNFADELKGVAKAGGLDMSDPKVVGAMSALVSGNPLTILANIDTVTALAKGAKRLMSGEEGADADYRVAASQARAEGDRMQEQQPGASLGGEVVGALASVPMAGGAAAAGANLGARMLQGARVAVPMGALAGAGEGTDLESRVTGAAKGGAVSGLLGAAAPVAVEGVVKAGQGISRAAAPLTAAFRGVRDPEAEAAKRVTQALQRDAAGGSAGMTSAQFAAERAAGTPVALGDMGGAATKSLARSSANTSAEGRAALEAVTSDRYATQSPRTATWLKETFDFPDPGTKLDEIYEASRRANRPAYLKAYNEGSKGIWDEGLEQISQAPVMQDAIRSAFVTARNRGAMEGFPPVKNPFALNKQTGAYELQEGTLPNLQFWDHVKRNLDRVNSPDSRAAAQILREHLDEVVPSYKTARQGAASFFGAEDALEAGAKFATMSSANAVDISKARGVLAKMSDPDRKLFETGFVSNLIAKVEGRTDGQDVVKSVFNSEFARKQIDLALGKDKASLLEAKLQTERVMNGLKEALGNSTTARQLYEVGMAGATHPAALAGLVGGASTYASGNVGPGDAFAAGLVFAARKGQIRIDERVAKRVGEMLASNDAAVLNKGMKIVANNDTLKKALRLFDVPTARVAGQQSGGGPALQSMGTGRAEE